MANKKISQLVGMGTGETVSGFYLLPVGAGPNGGPYVTKTITTKELADFIFTGDNSTYVGFPAVTLSGVNKEIYFNNDDDNWSTASNVVTQNPYLQVRASDGLLVTGSGIGAAVGGDNMGNCTATTDLNMQDNKIVNIGAEMVFKDNGNISNDATQLKMIHPVKLILEGTNEVEINSDTLIDINGTISLGGNVTIEPTFDLTAQDVTVEDIIVQKTSRHDIYTVDSTSTINWSDSNIQKTATATSIDYQFSNPLPGQTLTMYVENTASSTSILPTFASGSYVKWGGTGGPPHIDGSRTNVYTFICYDQVIFASAITGYEF